MKGASRPLLHMENQMTQRMLRHKPSGIMYVWQEAFAFRDDFEEIIDVEAKELKEPETIPLSKIRKTRKPEPAVIDEVALSEDASRDLP